MPAFIDENQQFIDPDTSAPIVNGIVLFGEQGASPEDEPIEVFADRALEVSLGTSGVPTDASGRTTQKVWIPGRYSFLVKNSAGSQKLIDLDAGSIPSVGITILSDIAGANNITALSDPTLTELVNGQQFTFTAVAINTDDMTLKIDSVDPKPIKFNFAEQMAPGFIQQNQTVNLSYNSIEDVFFWGNEGRAISLLTDVEGDDSTITANGGPSITGYVDKQQYSLTVVNSPAGSTTLEINNLGAITIKNKGVDIVGGQFLVDEVIVVAFNSIGPVFELISGGGNEIRSRQGADVASETQPNIWAQDGSSIRITGTTEIEDFTDAPRVGAKVTLIFDDILTLKEGLGITLPGAADILTAPGDRFEVYADSVNAFSGIFIKADGTPNVSSFFQDQVTVSGTSGVDFTNIPENVYRIIIMFTGVRTPNAINVLVQVGDTGGFSTTGYSARSARLQTGAANQVSNNTSGFVIETPNVNDSFSGAMDITKSTSTNEWVQTHTGGMQNDVIALGGGSKNLSGILDRIRVKPTSGNFDGGGISLRALAGQ